MSGLLADFAPVLTLWQPWASFMLPASSARDGFKWHETRSWPPPKALIGRPVLIHAALRAPGKLAPIVERLAQERWGAYWRERLPYGAIIGQGILREAYPADWRKGEDRNDLILGHWRTDRWAWRFDGVLPLPAPVPAKGKQRVWYVPSSKVWLGLASAGGMQ